MSKTRFSEQTGIGFSVTGCGTWRHVDMNGGKPAFVGPHYSTKTELLADHQDYLSRAGWLTPTK